MALDPVKLDTLDWKAMVGAVRGQIAAASDGKWTLHAPVDPGVTLLELFAALLEQRVYWMDQRTDPLVRAALALLGESPALTQCAATVMQVLPENAKPFGIVPRRTQLVLTRSSPPVTFSSGHPLVVLPLVTADPNSPWQCKLGIRVAGQDRTRDLMERGRIFRIFPADGSSAEVQIELPLSRPLPTPVPQGNFSVLFQLRTPATLLPQWHPDAPRRVPPPAQLSWWYRNAPGAPPVRFSHQQIEDGTQGLRRSGIVRVAIPEDWCPEATNGSGTTTYAIWLRVDKAVFSFPPRLSGLVPNVVMAYHRRRTDEHKLAERWLPIPGNRVALDGFASDAAGSGMPQQDLPPLEYGVRLLLRERDPVNAANSVLTPPRWYRWQATPDLYNHGPADRVFVVDRGRGELRFGDGLTGRLPVLVQPSDANDANIRVRYWVGGGTAGQVGEGRDWEGPDGLVVRNVVAAEGGDESEAVDAARQRAAAAVRRLTRAVTARDFEDLAATTPGVAIQRAHAAVGYHPRHPCTPVPGAVTVFIVPDAPRAEENDAWLEDAFVAAPVPDPGSLAAVTKRLDLARLVTTEVFVRAPRYHSVNLSVAVDADPADPLTLSQQIKERMRSFLDPLVGGDEHNGWPFGEPLRPSALLREAQDVLGDVGKVREVAIGLDGAAPTESCRDVAIGPHELVWLDQFGVRLNRSNQPSGGLR